VYGREINGQEHTFGVSGKLIKNALVMYDHQTDTFWSQFLRQGIKGELAGTELEVIPVTQTTWAAWLELHPDTLALNKSGRYSSDSYNGYYSGGRAGVIGEAHVDERLNTKEVVVGVDVGGNTKAYPYKTLAQRQVVNDTFQEMTYWSSLTAAQAPRWCTTAMWLAASLRSVLRASHLECRRS
jgi:hypothetical protein